MTAAVAFFLMPFSPFLSNAATRAWLSEEVQLEGFASILLTTIVLIAPALLLRRWRLPFGSLTTGFVLALLMHPPAIPAELSAAT